MGGGSSRFITILHRGGSPQFITILQPATVATTLFLQQYSITIIIRVRIFTLSSVLIFIIIILVLNLLIIILVHLLCIIILAPTRGVYNQASSPLSCHVMIIMIMIFILILLSSLLFSSSPNSSSSLHQQEVFTTMHHQRRQSCGNCSSYDFTKLYKGTFGVFMSFIFLLICNHLISVVMERSIDQTPSKKLILWIWDNPNLPLHCFSTWL